MINFMKIVFREAIKKSTTKLWTLYKKGAGLSGTDKLFNKVRFGHDTNYVRN